MVCPRCAKECEEGTRFCPRCGKNLEDLAREESISDDDEEMRCHWHPNRVATLRCGRCDKPGCLKCITIGPAGPRCKECGRSAIGFRPAAATLEARRAFRNLFRGPFSYILIFVLISLVCGTFRGCTTLMSRQQPTENIEIREPE